MALCKKPYITLQRTPAPCGQCLGCRTNKKQMWTNRIILESRSHDANSFVTLTYDDEHLPYNDDGIPTLRPEDITLFIKKLRSRLPYKIRYYAVGEYGTSGARFIQNSQETININPHFHLCIFGAGEETYKQVAQSWTEEGQGKKQQPPLGFTYVGSLTPKSAAYVAGYCMKKNKYNTDMYEEYDIVPEFARMSNRPYGIGGEAVKKIADALRRYPEGLTDTGDVPYSLDIGGRKLPLGNYLREKLRIELDMDRIEQEFYDEETGEIIIRNKWDGKELKKRLMAEEMRYVQENTEDPKMPEDAKVSIAHYLEYINAQSIKNFEAKHDLQQKTQLL